MTLKSNGRNDYRTASAVADRPVDSADLGVSSQVSGILEDVEHLLKQHLELLHEEIRADFRRTREAILAIGLGGALALAGGVLLIPALIGFLSWAVPAVPWWGWSGILAGTLFLAAFALYFAGKRKLKSFNPLPDQSLQAAKENLEWIGTQVTSTPK